MTAQFGTRLEISLKKLLKIKAMELDIPQSHFVGAALYDLFKLSPEEIVKSVAEWRVARMRKMEKERQPQGTRAILERSDIQTSTEGQG